MSQLVIQGTENIEIYHPNVMLISRQELSLIEKRIFMLIYENLKPLQHAGEDEINKVIELRIENVRKRIGNINWEDFKSAYKALHSRTYLMIDETNKNLDGLPYFQRVRYEGQSGMLEIKLNPEMNRAWINLSQGYTKQILECCLALSSNHALSIYNLICRYDKGKVVELEWLKQYLDIEGKFKNFNDFKRFVLERSQNEIGEKTDMDFMWTVSKRRGRKVVAIKMWGEPKVDLDSRDHEAVIAKLDQLGINERTHRQYICNHSDDFIEALRRAHAAAKTKKIENSGAYILKILGLVE